jgi:hypothetical protein
MADDGDGVLVSEDSVVSSLVYIVDVEDPFG